MSPVVNLLPQSCRRRFENWRQAKRWSGVWLATLGVFAFGHITLDQQQSRAQAELEAARSTTNPVRRAEAEIRRLQNEIGLNRRLVEAARAREQSDLTLALIQVVGDHCRDLGPSIRLESLRMDETGFAKQASNRPVVIRKQLMLIGEADSDTSVAMLVGRLRDCGMFEVVELESSQARTDQVASRRSFQIRCRQ